MNFVDQTLIRLANAATRTAVFDQLALEHLVAAGYDATGLGVSGPFQPVFNEVRLGMSFSGPPRIEGTWQRSGTAEMTEFRGTLQGLAVPGIRADALWRGAIIARAQTADSKVTAVAGKWADLRLEAIDAEIAAALGGLPTGSALESERRVRLRARLAATVVHPAVVSDATVAEWLSGQGVDSAASLFSGASNPSGTAGVSVTFAPPPAAVPAPRPLPVTVALLVREAGVSIIETLELSHRLQQALAGIGAQGPAGPVGRRQPILVGWVLPTAFLQDQGWPGANPTDRRRSASSWLGAEGIALVPVT